VRFAGLVAAAVVVILGILWALQRQLIYLPSAQSVPPVATVLPGGQDVVLETADGLLLGAWFVRARPPARDIAVLVANGNAGDRSSRAPLAQSLTARGFSVLLFDYRGYGANPGSPSQEGLALDVRAAQAFLEGAGYPPDRLLYFGESLGAAVVTELASSVPPAGMVLRSPFVDLASVGQLHYPFLPVRALLRDRFPLTEQLEAVPAPVTVVYGSADTVVPAEQSRTVAEAAPTLHAAVEVVGADHNDQVLTSGKPLIEAVISLAERVDPAG
jgi:fermentation-respiration switch protein FrsA (DUF1100 family)